MLGSIATTTLRWPTHVRQKAPCLQRVDNKKNAAIGRSEAHFLLSLAKRTQYKMYLCTIVS